MFPQPFHYNRVQQYVERSVHGLYRLSTSMTTPRPAPPNTTIISMFDDDSITSAKNGAGVGVAVDVGSGVVTSTTVGDGVAVAVAEAVGVVVGDGDGWAVGVGECVAVAVGVGVALGVAGTIVAVAAGVCVAMAVGVSAGGCVGCVAASSERPSGRSRRYSMPAPSTTRYGIPPVGGCAGSSVNR